MIVIVNYTTPPVHMQNFNKPIWDDLCQTKQTKYLHTFQTTINNKAQLSMRLQTLHRHKYMQLICSIT